MAHRRTRRKHSTHRKRSKHSIHRRRHSRRYNGGRGGMGGADLGHAFTTSASQELYQMTGKTPGLSSGGKRSTRKRSTRKRITRRALRK